MFTIFHTMVSSFVLTIVFCCTLVNLFLTTGVSLSLEYPTLMGSYIIHKFITFGRHYKSLSTTEHVFIRTFVMSSTAVISAGAFQTYLIGSRPDDKQTVLSPKLVDYVKYHIVQNMEELPRISGFITIITTNALFWIFYIREKLMLDPKFSYPNARNVAADLNIFHVDDLTKTVRSQSKTFLGSIGVSFLWGGISWAVSRRRSCGFATIPIFGRAAQRNKFYSNFSLTYFGVGLISPPMKTIAMIVGAIVSWGILTPILRTKNDWYSNQVTENNLHGLQAYRVYSFVGIILADSSFQLFKILFKSFLKIWRRKKEGNPHSYNRSEPCHLIYIVHFFFTILSIIAVPHIFPLLKWTYMFGFLLVLPFLVIPSAFAHSLFEWSIFSPSGSSAIFIIGSGISFHWGGAFVGICACGMLICILLSISTFADDYMVAFYTRTSPTTIFLSHLLGVFTGAVIGPLVYFLFTMSFPHGTLASSFSTQYDSLYIGVRNLTTSTTLSVLPRHCTEFIIFFFVFAILVNLLKEFFRLIGSNWADFIPSPADIAFPFYVGGEFVVDMFFGLMVSCVWAKLRRAHMELYALPISWGLISGENLWSLPASFLALSKIKAPFCLQAGGN